MSMSSHQSNPQQTNMDQLNWSYILTHPSEFVRLDEHLRLKQIELDGFHSRMVGWTKISAQENLEHRRMIYSMRCYLSITCTNRFGVSMLSESEYESLKNSFNDRDNFISENEKKYETLNNLSYNEYYLILKMASDRQQTERIYRKLLGKLLDEFEEFDDDQFNKEAVTETIIKKCFFTIE
jgi:hypothetical protein